MKTITDKNGRFEFKQLVVGIYSVSVQGTSGWGQKAGIAVEAGLAQTDVRVQLERVYTIQGKVDLSVYPKTEKADYIYIWFNAKNSRGGGNRGSRVSNTTGEFTVSGLPKGTYNAQISRWGSSDTNYRNGHLAQPLTVDRDLKNLQGRLHTLPRELKFPLLFDQAFL